MLSTTRSAALADLHQPLLLFNITILWFLSTYRRLSPLVARLHSFVTQALFRALLRPWYRLGSLSRRSAKGIFGFPSHSLKSYYLFGSSRPALLPLAQPRGHAHEQPSFTIIIISTFEIIIIVTQNGYSPLSSFHESPKNC